MVRSSFGQWYLKYEDMKHGTSFVEDPLSMMVMNLPFLLLAAAAISASIKSAASRNMHRASPEE